MDGKLKIYLIFSKGMIFLEKNNSISLANNTYFYNKINNGGNN